VANAAKAAYRIGNVSHRVLYQIQNAAPNSLQHCDFTDKGCPICPCSGDVDNARKLVGQSVSRFVHAIRDGSFERKTLMLDSNAVSVNMFVNTDQVEATTSATQEGSTRTHALA
jgi:hypothetical protein